MSDILIFSYTTKAMYGDTPCLIFHDVDLIPLDGRNIYGCSIEGPRHLSANLHQFRYLLPYENLFGGVIALPTKVFQDVNGFSNQWDIITPGVSPPLDNPTMTSGSNLSSTISLQREFTSLRISSQPYHSLFI